MKDHANDLLVRAARAWHLAHGGTEEQWAADPAAVVGRFVKSGATIAAPVSIEDAVAIKAAHPSAEVAVPLAAIDLGEDRGRRS